MKRILILLGAISILGVSNHTNAQEVKINNDFVVETDGTLRLDNNATTWEDLRVPLSSANKKLETDYDFISGNSGPKVDWFDDKDENEMYFVAQLPHAYVEGTNIFPHIHWIPEKDGSAGKKPSFGLEYAWYNLGEPFPGYTTIYGETVIIPGNENYTGALTALTHYLSPFNLDGAGASISGIDGTGKKISSMLVCRVFRDPRDNADSYGDKIGLLEVDFHFEVNTMGSRSEFTK